MAFRRVVFHTPRSDWEFGTGLREQPGIMAHIQHAAGLLESGRLLFDGPFVDANGGGRMIADETLSRKELEAFAAVDPAVQSGLRNCAVKTGYGAMSGS